MTGLICPKCDGAADTVQNPPRYTLPAHRGVCRDCGHEWNLVAPVTARRYGQ